MLQKQTIEVPLGVGIQTKADPKVVQPGSMLVVENGEFDELGAVSKRNGYTALTQSTLSGGTISAGKIVSRLRDELVMLDGSDLYGYAATAAKWVNRGGCLAAGMKHYRVPASSAAQTGDVSTTSSVGVAYSNGYIGVTWVTNAGGIYATVYEHATGAVVYPCTELSASGTHVTVVASGTKIFFVFSVVDIHMQYFDTSSPSSGLSLSATLATDYFTGGPWEVCDFDGAGTCVLACEKNTSASVDVYKFTSAGSTAGPTTTAGAPGESIGVVVSAAQDIYVATQQGANLNCFALTSSLASKFGVTFIEAPTSVWRIVGIEQSTNSILWVYGDRVSNVYNTRKAVISSAAAVSGVGLVMGGVNVASGIFSYGGDFYFIAQSSAYSGTELGGRGAWLVNTSGEVHGVALAGYAAYAGANQPSRLASLGSGIYSAAIMAQFDTDNQYVPVELRIETGRRCEPVEFAQSLYIPGAQLWQYDGAQVVEHGFLVPPVATGSNVAGGVLADGSYQICAVYEWYDTYGRRHQSAPSVANTVTISGGGGARKITATIQTLRLTNKTGVDVVLYVTAAGGTTFYRYSSTDNTKTANTVTIDFTTVVGLTDNEILYTNGGVLENTAPPGMQSLAVKGPRLYGVTFDGTVNYTKELIDGEGSAFVAETLVRELTNDGGDEWALAAMDSALVALGERSIQVLTGEGLNDTGTSDTLSQPQLVQASLGRYGNTPVVTSEHGVWFKTETDIALLTRALAVEAIGAPAEDYMSLTTVSAVVVPSKRQIRFGHSDGSTLVYDYFSGQWSVFTNHTQVSACYWGTTYCLLTSAGAVWQQSTGFEDPSSTAITLTLQTPWIKLSGLQGYQRLWYLSILGEFRSAHTLTLTPYYDYSTTAGTAVSLALTGTSGDPLQFRTHLSRPCQSVKIKIVDSSQSGTKESCALTALALEVGGKGGIFRQATSKTV